MPPPPSVWLPPGHALIIGATGKGKTVRLRAWADTLPRYVYLAPVADPASWPVRRGERIVREHEQGAALHAFAVACAEGRPARFIVEARTGADYAADAAAWAAVVLVCGDATLIVDDVEEVLEGGVPPELIRLVWRGRKARAWLWAAAHRPLGIPRAFTSQGSVVAFQTGEPRDLRWYDDAGVPAVVVSALAPYTALVREPDGTLRLLDRHGRAERP